ncbi:MAG: hypothetical protein WHS89_12625 [Acidimicrobiales bacterium]|jgi:hypothetical protein
MTADTTIAPNSPPTTDVETAPTPLTLDGRALERRGRAWLLWSFLLCPCHLPLTLGVLTTVLAGTSLGVVLREHAWVAGVMVTVVWLLGTGYGLRLIRRAERANGICALPASRRSDARRGTR